MDQQVSDENIEAVKIIQTPKKRSLNLIYILVGLLLLAGLITAFFAFIKTHSVFNTQGVKSRVTSSMKVTDMSPSTPKSQKTAVVIMHSDSSMEEFIIPDSEVNNFIGQLSPDSRVISKTQL